MKKALTEALLNPGMALNAQLKIEAIKSFVLKNGMKFLVIKDNSIPKENRSLYYKVGPGNEYQGITDFSHFLST